MITYAESYSDTFTVTHARHIAAKVATDLKRMQRFYKHPSDEWIDDFETEIVQLLKGGYLATVIYGFQRGGKWVEPTLIYQADDIYADIIDDDPGRVRPRAPTNGANFCSYLTYSRKWYMLSEDERHLFQCGLPFYRTGGNEPGVDGYLQSNDKTYSAGGKALRRTTVRSFQ